MVEREITNEEAIAILEAEAEYLYSQDEPYNWLAFKKAIEALKAEPIKHGKWIMKQHMLFHQQLPYCSVCDKTAIFAYDNCPHCRAKMDEV